MNITTTGDMPTITGSTYGATYFTLGNRETLQEGLGATSRVNPLRCDCSDVLGISAAVIHSMSKRIVRVYLADTDDQIPLEMSLLYTSSEKLTDATDQELYFEIPIVSVLEAHNTYRKTVVDKKLTQKIGKEAFLEPIKIRDLKMTVVSIASF